MKNLPKSLTTVTPLSKFLAGMLFILLPFMAFYIGIKYQKNITTKCEVVQISENAQENTQKETNGIIGLPNPSSVNCVQKGGNLTMMKRPDGAVFGLCNFDDGRSCEEWAMFRNECPIGGVKTTGLDTTEQKYCAWVGGETSAISQTCTFKDGSTCDNLALYNGTCKKGF